MAERCCRCGGQDVRRAWLVDGAWTDVRDERATLERVACRSTFCGAVLHVTCEGAPDRERRLERLAIVERPAGLSGREAEMIALARVVNQQINQAFGVPRPAKVPLRRSAHTAYPRDPMGRRPVAS